MGKSQAQKEFEYNGQVRYAYERVKDPSKSKVECARIAGYSESTAKKMANRIEKMPHVQEIIQKMSQQAAEEALVSRTWVIQRFKDISDRCMQAEPVMIKRGNELVESGEYEFDSSGANTATRELGKLIDAYPVEKKDIDLNIKEMPEIIIKRS